MFSIPFLDLPPLHRAGGTVTLPGSKSISNRVLLLAALSTGETVIHDLLDSDDTRVMLAALATLGCGIEHSGPQQIKVQGLAGQLPVKNADLFLGNAGTAMRPLTAALALLASEQGGNFTLRGIPRMHERPIGDLVDGLRQLGCPVSYLANEGYPPLQLGSGSAVPLSLQQPIKVRGNVSSQFLTALLLALPLVASQDIVIEVVGELISKPYIDITLQLLQRFGVQVARDGWQRFTIPAGSRYQSPGCIHVEGDASSASYFIALGAIAESDTGITVQGVGLNSIQGDIRFVEAAQAMGADIRGSANSLHIRRGQWPLQAIDLDCNHIPDAAMTLAIMALYANGTTTLRNIESWRVKETDRIVAMATELRKLGATVEEGQDFIRITPPALSEWQAASIHTYDDHRVAMCFSLAAFNPAQSPVRIEDPKCVAKTFPDYFEALFGVVQAKATHIPVLCVDGPTASGKGTLASRLAQALGYTLLDSGALYRVTAYAAVQAGLELDTHHESAIAEIARHLPVSFVGEQVLLAGTDVTAAIRSELGGMNASKVSTLAAVRTALIDLQHSFRRLPGLVTDGRDMGTVIFPDAPLKIFLTANAEQRAIRRHKQLLSRGVNARLEDLLADLVERDLRDTTRQNAPLQAAADALPLDNSNLSIETSVQQVLTWWQHKCPF